MNREHLFGLILLIFFVSDLSAQDRKDIRINFGLQWNMPERIFNDDLSRFNNKNGGIGFHIYPKWQYSEKLAIGVNLEYAMVTENYQTDDIGMFDIFSLSPTIQYYFTTTDIRPFVGFGLGFYTVRNNLPKINWGVRPVVGVSIFDVFDISFEYNRILADVRVEPDKMGEFDNYYVALKGSFSIGITNKR